MCSMDGQEYLDRISAKNQPSPKKFQGTILSSRFFWVGAVGIVAFILIAILGAVLKGSGGKSKDIAHEIACKRGAYLSIQFFLAAEDFCFQDFFDLF